MTKWPHDHALNTKLFPPRIGSSSLLLHATCVVSSQSSLLDPMIIRIGHSSLTISWLQSQDHKPLLSVCRTSLVEQASCYSSCSLSVRSIIIAQLFSIVMLWSWTACLCIDRSAAYTCSVTQPLKVSSYFHYHIVVVIIDFVAWFKPNKAILALSLMNISLSLTKSLHCLNLVIVTFVNFVVSVLILILKQLVPSPPPLFTLSLITTTPSNSISLSLIQLIQNYLARVVVNAPKSCHISPVLKSLHWLKMHERIDYVYVTTWSTVDYTSVTSIMHCRPCCNKLISWPSQTWVSNCERNRCRARRAWLDWLYGRRIESGKIWYQHDRVQTAVNVLGILAATAVVHWTFVKHVWK